MFDRVGGYSRVKHKPRALEGQETGGDFFANPPEAGDADGEVCQGSHLVQPDGEPPIPASHRAAIGHELSR
jgi:hypothetical protein